MSTANIDIIRSKKSIMEYLELRGHTPDRSLGGGRFAFRCPFPDHNETKPSFMVWTRSQYENFYCFGCQRHNSIIDLVAGLEGISFKAALEKLSDGLGITISEEIALKVDHVNVEYRPPEDFELSESMLMISTYCQTYLTSVENDTSEVEMIDRFYTEMDSNLLNYEFDKIENSVANLPYFLSLRHEKYEEDKLLKAIKEHESRKCY